MAACFKLREGARSMVAGENHPRLLWRFRLLTKHGQNKAGQ